MGIAGTAGRAWGRLTRRSRVLTLGALAVVVALVALGITVLATDGSSSRSTPEATPALRAYDYCSNVTLDWIHYLYADYATNDSSAANTLVVTLGHQTPLESWILHESAATFSGAVKQGQAVSFYGASYATDTQCSQWVNQGVDVYVAKPPVSSVDYAQAPSYPYSPSAGRQPPVTPPATAQALPASTVPPSTSTSTSTSTAAPSTPSAASAYNSLLGTWVTVEMTVTFSAAPGKPGELTTQFGGLGKPTASSVTFTGVQAQAGTITATYDFATDPDNITISQPGVPGMLAHRDD